MGVLRSSQAATTSRHNANNQCATHINFACHPTERPVQILGHVAQRPIQQHMRKFWSSLALGVEVLKQLHQAIIKVIYCCCGDV